MPAIVFDDVSKLYLLRHAGADTLKESLIRLFRHRDSVEQFAALSNISLKVEPGESVGIIGPNGSGKSTLLKLISHILRPDTGSIEVNGEVSALLELGAGFHPELTGRENIFLYGSILGLSREEIHDRFESIVAFAELPHFVDLPLKNYSSGMFMRLGFACAVSFEPDIILIDEALAVGDLAFQEKCAKRIKEFQSRGRTLVLVSHSMQQIRDLCSRVIVLNEGQIIRDGEVEPVLDTYFDIMGIGKERPLAGNEIRLPDGRIIKVKWNSQQRVGTGDCEITDLDFLSRTEKREQRSTRKNLW